MSLLSRDTGKTLVHHTNILFYKDIYNLFHGCSHSYQHWLSIIEPLHAKMCLRGFWLVVLRLNVPVNNFSVMSGRSHRFLGN